MQRITRYPLIIKSVSTPSEALGRMLLILVSKAKVEKHYPFTGISLRVWRNSSFAYISFCLGFSHFFLHQILENTPENHPDHSNLRLALERAEELCSQVNEGVREKENSDRLEWIQSHVQCEGLAEVAAPLCCTAGASAVHFGRATGVKWECLLIFVIGK